MDSARYFISDTEVKWCPLRISSQEPEQRGALSLWKWDLGAVRSQGTLGGMVSLRSDAAERTPAPWLWPSQHTWRTALVFQGIQFGLSVVCPGTGIISVQGNTRSVSMPLSNINTQVLLYTSVYGWVCRTAEKQPPSCPRALVLHRNKKKVSQKVLRGNW